MTSPIRVLVVDDHLVSRRGLATLLLTLSDMVMVGEAKNGMEALELCDTMQPDVVLMDLLMPEMDGAKATSAIRKRYPEIKVLVLTAFDEYALLQRALAAGADGVLLKNMSCDDLGANIRQAYVQDTSLTPRSIGDKMQAAQLPSPPTTVCSVEFTEREQNVLALMAQGMTNPQIGAELFISRATVKCHVSSILAKLCVSSRTEAVALAVQQHLTSLPM
jgi:NarL family two-component system response regulator LiaR